MGCSRVSLSHLPTPSTSPLMLLGDTFLRARAYLVGGKLIKASGPGLHPVGASLMQQTLKTLTEDTSEVVRVACIRVLQDYLQTLPAELNQSLQTTVIDALSHYFSALDPNDLTESDELMVAVAVTLRDAIAVNTSICVAPNSTALSLLFTIGSRAPNNFQLTELVNETFEKIAGNIAETGPEAYARLCEIVLPSLTGAFDIGEMTGEGALSNVSIHHFLSCSLLLSLTITMTRMMGDVANERYSSRLTSSRPSPSRAQSRYPPASSPP